MNHVVDWLSSHRWAITREVLETIVGIAKRNLSLNELNTEVRNALQVRDGEPLPGSRRTDTRGSVAIIPIIGSIVPRGGYFSSWSSAASIATIAKDLTVAIEDPTVEAIVLNIDSPGGDITGVSELATYIYESRGKKPIVAYVYGLGASAAYWIATAADRIVAADTSEVGSIGVVSTYTDWSEWDKKNGLKEIEIVSSQSPKKRLSPSSEAGRAEVQKIVDDLADIFISAVARHRGVTSDKVVSDFGEGGVMVASRALSAGMIDEVGSLEKILSQYNVTPKEGFFMNITELQTKHPEVYSAVLDAGKKAASDEAQAVQLAAISAASTEAATKERGRIQGILSLKTAAGLAGQAAIDAALLDATATKESVAVKILEAQATATTTIATAITADGRDLAAQIRTIESNAPASSAAAAAEEELGKAMAKLADEITV
jgi:signal peptide peptidase SppA